MSAAKHRLNEKPDGSLAEAQYAALVQEPEALKVRLLADAWGAAFVWEKAIQADGLFPLTDGLYRQLEQKTPKPHSCKLFSAR